MNGNIFLRTSVVFLTIGVSLGLYMGGSQHFEQAATHAHLNLVGGVWMFLAGLFYNHTAGRVSPKLIATHYVLAVVGVITFIPGLFGEIAGYKWALPLLMGGSMLTGLQILLFAILVFVGTGKTKTALM